MSETRLSAKSITMWSGSPSESNFSEKTVVELKRDCRQLLDRANAIIEVNHYEDPTYKVVSEQ